MLASPLYVHDTSWGQPLAYFIFGTGWPTLIIGTIWIRRKMAGLTGPARTFLLTSLITFYVLGYTSTVYWLGQPWPIGVLPAFAVFLVLFVVTIRAVRSWSRAAT